MFASQVTDTVEIVDVVITIRKLGWKKLREASEERQKLATAEALRLAPLVAAGEAARRERAEHADEDTPREPSPQGEGAPDESARRRARYAQYDRDIVLRSGVKSWTAKGTDSKPVEVNNKYLDDLFEDVADRLHRAILDLSLPPLDDAAEEDARKND